MVIAVSHHGAMTGPETRKVDAAQIAADSSSASGIHIVWVLGAEMGSHLNIQHFKRFEVWKVRLRPAVTGLRLGRRAITDQIDRSAFAKATADR